MPIILPSSKLVLGMSRARGDDIFYSRVCSALLREASQAGLESGDLIAFCLEGCLDKRLSREGKSKEPRVCLSEFFMSYENLAETYAFITGRKSRYAPKV